jgi:hypothetical protein
VRPREAWAGNTNAALARSMRAGLRSLKLPHVATHGRIECLSTSAAVFGQKHPLGLHAEAGTWFLHTSCEARKTFRVIDVKYIERRQTADVASPDRYGLRLRLDATHAAHGADVAASGSL